MAENNYERVKKAMFLLGEFQNRIDPRGRAFVPVKIRDQLGSPVYMVLGERKCIECYNEEGIRKKYENTISGEGGLLSKNTAETAIFTNGDTQPIDNQGRIILKPDFISAIGADKDVVFLGANDHFEIWSKEEYDKVREKTRDRVNTASEIEDLEEELRLLERKKALLERKKALEAEIGEI